MFPMQQNVPKVPHIEKNPLVPSKCKGRESYERHVLFKIIYFKCYFPKRLYKALHWELRQGHMNVNMPNMFSFGFHCRCFMPGKSFVAILDRQICCF